MNIVGLDLGIHTFKAVEIKKERGKAEIQKFGIQEVLDVNITSINDEELKRYSKALSAFYDNSGFTTPNVIASLPESSVFETVVKMPRVSPKELKTAIVFEAEQSIPLPLKDVNYSYQIIEHDEQDEKDKMNVFIVAAPKILVDKYVKILKGASLIPIGLEPETLALARVVGDKIDQPNPSIVVTVDSNATTVIVVYKGVVRFARNISTGGDALTRAVAQGLGFDFSQAEEYKKTYGLDSSQVDGKVYGAIKPVFDIILNEIKRAYYFYTTHNPNVNIRRVVVCGGTALMPGLLFYLTTNLNLEVELANPWQNIGFSPKLEKDRQNLIDKGPFFVTSVGLALKEG